VKSCTACGVENGEDAEYCSWCGATLEPDSTPRRTSGAGRAAGGIFTGFGIAVVYFVVETVLGSGTGDGYLLAGRICLGPVLAIGWTLLVIVALVYSMLNRTIKARLGEAYVTASAVTALLLLTLPVTVCTLIAAGEISTCRAPAI